MPLLTYGWRDKDTAGAVAFGRAGWLRVLLTAYLPWRGGERVMEGGRVREGKEE